MLSLGLHNQGDYLSRSGGSSATGSTTTLTVSAWVKFAKTATSGYIAGNGDSSDLRIEADGKVRFYCYTGASGNSLLSPDSYANGDWHLIVGRRNGTSLKLFVDNVLVAGLTLPDNASNSYLIQAIGQRGNNVNFYKGFVRGVRLYNTAISDARIAEIYAAGAYAVGASETGLVAGYNLNEGSSTSFADFSGNNKTFALSNPNSMYSNWFDADRAQSKTFYVKPTGAGGTTTGSTIAGAWSLAYALSHPPEVLPGDTIKVIDDSIFLGRYESFLTGTPAKRITFRPVTLGKYPLPITIDAAFETTHGYCLSLSGDFTDYWDIKGTNSNPPRVSNQNSTLPTDIAQIGAFTGTGGGNRLINFAGINTNSNAFDIYNPTATVEIVNGFAYGNGWRYPTVNNGVLNQAAGNGFYVHNENPNSSIVFKDFVSLNSIFQSIQHFADNAAASYNLTVEGLIASQKIANITGNLPKHNFQFSKIFTYKADFSFGGSSGGGTSDFDFDDANLYSDSPLTISTWTQTSVTNSKLAQTASNASDTMRFNRPAAGALSNHVFNSNEYWRGRLGVASEKLFHVFDENGSNPLDYTFNEWKALGLDLNSVNHDKVDKTSADRPTGFWIRYLPHSLMAGRGLFAVWNWDLASTVSINLSSFNLSNNQSFKIYNLENPEVVFAADTYNAGNPNINLSMVSNGVLPFTNDENNTPNSTFPEFGAFLIVPSSRRTFWTWRDGKVER